MYTERKKTSKAEAKKKSKQGLLKACKSCKKKMGKKSILMHLSQKESCKNDYTEEEMDFLRGWSDKRKKQNESNYYQRKKKQLSQKYHKGTKRKKIKRERKLEEKKLKIK